MLRVGVTGVDLHGLAKCISWSGKEAALKNNGEEIESLGKNG
jgi:hypothetical protein